MISLTTFNLKTSSRSRHRLAVSRSVPARDEMLDLPFDIRQERARAKPEKIGDQPRVAQLLLHEDEPRQRLFGVPDPPCRLETDAIPRQLEIIPDGPRHGQSHGQ